MHASREATHTLPDGRTLSYAEFGDAGGKPLFYFHGWPGSRFEGEMLDEAARSAGSRLIVVERPGYGRSSFQRGRRILDWPLDIASLADALGIERFAVLGYSGGGPYAAACAHELPERLTSATIVSGVAPRLTEKTPRWRRVLIAAGRPLLPLVRGPLLYMKTTLRIFGYRAVASGRWTWSPPDREILARRVAQGGYERIMREALRPGVRGAAHDFALLAGDWQFALEHIRVPVHLWHGERDWLIRVDRGHAVADAIPACDAHLIPGEGHLMIFERAPEILRWAR